ncbi:MAG: sulfite exporter TauE/SafE family protein, partial [Bacteroidota bacterium]|nr:sulfite exporter TauE/SafE family protein [Bacteroidota bacterium]
MRLYFLILLVVWSVWLFLMNSLGYWPLFTENWFMSVTMMFGSFIAGATSEGGGAVAFPVMTLGYNISPEVARDFSLMIQSVGMLAASIVIILNNIEVEWRAILFASIGGVLGIILGIDFLSPALSPTMTKLFFVSAWLGFGIALIWVNRDRERHTHSQIDTLLKRDSVLILLVGFIGGLVSGVTGSGLDIVTFSLLVLYFSISEKVAT